MAKNNSFVNYMNTLAKINHNERVREAAEKDTVQIYAALAMALYDLLDEDDEEKTYSINTIFNRSLEIWTDFVETGTDVVAECERQTGIKLVYDKEK